MPQLRIAKVEPLEPAEDAAPPRPLAILRSEPAPPERPWSAPTWVQRQQQEDLTAAIAEHQGAKPAETDAPPMSRLLVPTALRVAPTIAGAVAGSLAGPVGTAAGGAAGAGLGELAAQKYEGRDPNYFQAAVQAVLGAVPIAGRVGSTVLPAVVKRGAQGAALGGVGAGATEFAETGEMPSASTIATGAGFGAVLGGSLAPVEARAMARLARAKAPVSVTAPGLEKMSALSAAQNEALTAAPTWKSNVAEGASKLRERFTTQFAAVEDFIRSAGLDPIDTPAAINPVKAIDLAHGGTPGKIERMADLYKGVHAEAKELGVEAALQDYLNLNALEAGVETLENKARRGALPRRAQPKQMKLPGLPELQAQWAQQDLGLEDLSASWQRSRLPDYPDLPARPGTPEAASARPARQLSLADEVMPPGQGELGLDPAQMAATEAAQGRPALGDGLTARLRDRVPGGSLTGTQGRLFGSGEPTQLTLPGSGRRQPDPRQPWPAGSGNPRVAPDVAEATAREALDATRGRTSQIPLGEATPPYEGQGALPDVDANVANLADQAAVNQDVAARLARAEATGARVSDPVQSPLYLHEKSLPMGLQPSDLRDARRAWAAVDPEVRTKVEALAQRVFALNEEVLDRAHAAGLIRDEVYRDLKGRAATAVETGRAGYAPLTRIMDEVEEGYRRVGLNMPTQHVLYDLKGSERMTVHPLVSSLQKAAIATQEIEKNLALKTLVTLPEALPNNAFIRANIRRMEPGGKVPEGFGVVSLFEKGERVDYAVPAVLADSLKALDGPTTRVLGETVLRAVGNVFRSGTTVANLAFSIPNVLRDIRELQRLETRLSESRIGEMVRKEIPYLPVAKQWAESWLDVVKQSPRYLAYLDSGAAFSTFQKSMLDPRSLLNIVPKDSIPQIAGRVVKSPLTFAKWFNNSLEEATKLTAFTRQLDTGVSTADAAWAARRFGGSPDFARRGRWISPLNTVFPFLNAQIQGMARIVPYVKRHPESAVFALAALTAKQALVQQYNNSFVDPDGTRSWDRITDVEKQHNHVLFVPGTFTGEGGIERQNYIKIPVSHAENLFRAPIQAALDPTTRGVAPVVGAVAQQMPLSPDVDLSSKEAAVQSAADSVVSSLNPAVRVPAEQMMNRDTFRGVPLIPRRMENVTPAQQFTDTTSPAAVAFGQATGTSPLRIQHATRGFLGGVGEQALSVGDAIANPSEALARPPIVTPIARRFWGGYDPRVDQEARTWNDAFYQAYHASNVATATVAALRKRGDQRELAKFLQNPSNLAAYNRAKGLQRYAAAISKARQQQDVAAERQLLQSVYAVLERP